MSTMFYPKLNIFLLSVTGKMPLLNTLHSNCSIKKKLTKGNNTLVDTIWRLAYITSMGTNNWLTI